MTKHAVLLGDPSHFRIKGGKNPYTRNRLGFRKRVNRKKAREQWSRFKDTLESLGAKTFVMPPDRGHPGMVFPANAGFLHPKYEPRPWREKTFYLANLTAAHRIAEQGLYREFLAKLGFQIGTLPFPFEGEADFIPCDDLNIFCYGDIVSSGFVPRLGIPPWRYRFSHRTDYRNVKSLEKITGGEVLEAKLVDTRYYHGDTALFAFGPRRENLFAYMDAFDRDTQVRIKKRFGRNLFSLSRADTENFVANSFQLDTPQGPHVLFPKGVSAEVTNRVESLGIPHTEVDVSEFFSKGGGSIKCMLCDLGPVTT